MTDTSILMAQIGAAHGIKGEVRVKPFGDPDLLDQYGKLHSDDGRKFKIKRMRPQKNVLVVKFEGVNTREESEALNGVKLFVERSKLPEIDEDGEFYIQDLVGCEVFGQEGDHIGKVIMVPNFGAGDMLEISPMIEGGGFSPNTYFLPFTEQAVPEIDFENRKITVVPPVEVSERDGEAVQSAEPQK